MILEEKFLKVFTDYHNELNVVVEQFYTPIKDKYEKLPNNNKFITKVKRIIEYYFLQTFLYFESKKFIKANEGMYFDPVFYSNLKKNSLEMFRKTCYYTLFTKINTEKDKKICDNFNQLFKEFYIKNNIEKC